MVDANSSNATTTTPSLMHLYICIYMYIYIYIAGGSRKLVAGVARRQWNEHHKSSVLFVYDTKY